MSFADPAAVPAEVAACGRSLGLHPSFDALTLDQQVRLVEEAWHGPTPRLLVFDNCEEEELLRRWRPASEAPACSSPAGVPNGTRALGVKTVPLTTLPRPASIELLRRFRPDVPEPSRPSTGSPPSLAICLWRSIWREASCRRYARPPFGQPAAYLESLRQTDLLDHPSSARAGSPGSHRRP